MPYNYDLGELLAFAQREGSARKVIEAMGLTISERQVQRIIARHLGPRPTRQSISKPDILRERVVAYMESQGKSPRHCFVCGRVQLRGGAIRAVNGDLSLDALEFVCLKCAAPGDV